MYQLDNYVLFKDKEYAKIFSINKDIIGVESKDYILATTAPSNISGIPLREKVLESLDLMPTSRQVNPLSIKLMYNIIVHGKIHRLYGHEFKDGAIWNLSGVSVRYFHEVQNIMTIIEPGYKIKLF